METEVKDILIKGNRFNSLPESTPLREALKLTNRRGEGIFFIVDSGNKLTGVVTDGDIRRGLGRSEDLMDRPVSHVMTSNPMRLRLTAPFDSVLGIMRDHSINALAVTDERNRYLGLITLHDVLRHYSPERIYLGDHDSGDENIQRHMARYRFAAGFMAKGWRVLDCACGSGYGSAVIAERAGRVVGVDRSSEAIGFAEKNHPGPGVEYLCKDLEDLDFGKESFDAVVSFETIEHIPKASCEVFLQKSVSWLKPGGILILSSPMLRFRDNRPYVTNPYHINEMPKEELLTLLDRYLEEFTVHLFHQKQDIFLPLMEEHTGFMVAVARKRN